MQVMVRKLSIILLLLAMVLALSACADREGGTILIHRSVRYEHTITGDFGTHYEVDYFLERLDLHSMIEDSDLVLIGEVVNQEEVTDLSVWSEVKVLHVSRGQCKDDTIHVLHMKSCPIFLGEEYLLVLLVIDFLQPGESYSIMGGHQGIFRQLDGKIEVTDADFIPVIERKFGGKNYTIYALAKWFTKF